MRVLFAILLAVLSACASAAEIAQARREAYLVEHPETSEAMQANILGGKVVVGMSQDQVRAAWGKPRFRRSRTDAQGKATVWEYTRTVGMGHGRYAYVPDYEVVFVNDRVVSWEDQDAGLEEQRLTGVRK